MPSETTRLLRRAIALRHTPEARTFWAAVLDALTAGTTDPEAACRALLAALADPPGVAAETVSDWLATLVLSGADPIDHAAVLAHTEPVGVALAAIAIPPTAGRDRVRARAREAMATALVG